jgi:glycosyltransferase involved in cell wall biosynthesis
VHLLGPLQPVAVYAQMARRRALVLPSIWYENFPRTLVEAFGNGLPVIASRLGAMATLVEDGVTGLLFNPGDATDLAAKLAWADAHPAEMQRMGERARRLYEAELTGLANLQQLRAIYREASALCSPAHPRSGKP